MVNEPPAERARALVERADTAVVVLDAERRLVAASAPAAAVLGGTEPGRRLGEELLAAHPELLALFLDSAPELSQVLGHPVLHGDLVAGDARDPDELAEDLGGPSRVDGAGGALLQIRERHPRRIGRVMQVGPPEPLIPISVAG